VVMHALEMVHRSIHIQGVVSRVEAESNRELYREELSEIIRTMSNNSAIIVTAPRLYGTSRVLQTYAFQYNVRVNSIVNTKLEYVQLPNGRLIVAGTAFVSAHILLHELRRHFKNRITFLFWETGNIQSLY
jgi:hypothetical protein